MSREYQGRFLREQIAEYDELLSDRARGRHSKARRNIIKTIEKQKAAREQAEGPARRATRRTTAWCSTSWASTTSSSTRPTTSRTSRRRRRWTASRASRPAGQRAGVRPLHEVPLPARAAPRATASPSPPARRSRNTLVELYTMQRFLDPDGLRARGIEHFDAWAATFGEVVESDGDLPRTARSLRAPPRFAKFVNLPELQQMFRSLRRRPDGGDAEPAPSEASKAASPRSSPARCPTSSSATPGGAGQAVRAASAHERVDPREDNALAITHRRPQAGTGRPDALRACAPTSRARRSTPGRQRGGRSWERLPAGTRGTQMIFCDMGVHPTPWGYSAYDEIVEKLVARRHPRDQIAVDGRRRLGRQEAGAVREGPAGLGPSPARLHAEDGHRAPTSRSGRRPCTTSTPRGSPPRSSSERGASSGRATRTPRSPIYRYVTEGSFDAYMWQALETKARFITQVMTGEVGGPAGRGRGRPGASATPR